MNRKKIAITYSGSRNRGGIDKYLVNLFKYFDRSKIDLTLLSLGSWEIVREIEKQGGQIKIFSKTRFNPITVLKIASFLRKENFNLIVSGGLVADSYSRAASLFSGVPHLSVVHSEFKNDYPNLVVRLIYSLLIFISRWKTKKYIAVSEYIKKNLIKSGINGNKITVLYNGVEFNDVKERDYSSNKRVIIGSIGRLHKVKGYENLIKAASKIKNRDWQLKILGEGNERNKLKSLINGFNLSKEVELCGQTDNPPKFLSELNIYIQPSLSEGFGLTVVEAMGAGLPVIVTPVGSLPEIVKHNITGIIAEGTDLGSLAEAINKLVGNPQKVQELGKAASKNVRARFNIKNWSDKTIDVFLGAAK